MRRKKHDDEIVIYGGLVWPGGPTLRRWIAFFSGRDSP